MILNSEAELHKQVIDNIMKLNEEYINVDENAFVGTRKSIREQIRTQLEILEKIKSHC